MNSYLTDITDYVVVHRGFFAVVFLGLSATVLYFKLFFGNEKKEPTLLRGLHHPVLVSLAERKMINHDTMILKLKFPGENLLLGLPVGQHIRIYGKSQDGEQIYRSYTPISKVDQRGYLELLIKVYFPNDKFPKGGQLTQYLHKMRVGSRVRISGPKGKLIYRGASKFFFKKKDLVKKYKKISMIAGGSGITPLYQIIIHLMEEGIGKYEVGLLFANKTEEDILMRKKLEQLKDSGMIKLFYTLDHPKPEWKFYKGFVDDQMIRESFPKPSEDHLMITCGPRPMINNVLKDCLKLGYKEENVFLY